MVGEQLERVRTFDAAVGFVLPTPTAMVPPGGRVEQGAIRSDTVYFDTQEHDLLAHGVTLRCRTGIWDAGWGLTVRSG